MKILKIIDVRYALVKHTVVVDGTNAVSGW